MGADAGRLPEHGHPPPEIPCSGERTVLEGARSGWWWWWCQAGSTSSRRGRVLLALAIGPLAHKDFHAAAVATKLGQVLAR
ncbi:MAG TPA: hypothetical protein VFC19_08870 [Candidatus Limnocylindrales bacterium]|nr:hypothetical protein [Candidatus Limnocylindrales bacterium]